GHAPRRAPIRRGGAPLDERGPRRGPPLRSPGHPSSFACACAPLTPTTLTVFSGLLCPDVTSTSRAPTPSAPASSSHTALLARPSSGGALTFTFNLSPSTPTIWSRRLPGTTFSKTLVATGLPG